MDIRASNGHGVAKDLDRLIDSQHRKRVAEEGVRPAEAPYAKTEREVAAVRRESNRLGWAEHYRNLASTHYGLAEEALRKARKYERIQVPNLPKDGHHEP